MPPVPDAPHSDEIVLVIATRTPDTVQVANWRDLLPENELQRIDGFRRTLDAERSALARIIVRLSIGSWLGISPIEVPLIMSATGRPESLSGHSISWAHTDDLVTVAFAASGSIGVDVEAMRTMNDLPQLAHTFCHASEYTALMECPEERRESLFYRLWTRKEALGKALGIGVTEPDRLGFVIDELGEPRIPCSTGDGVAWWVEEYACGDGYCGAIAWDRAPRRVRCLCWMDDPA